MGVRFVDNTAKVKRQLDANMERAANAVGTEAVGMIVRQMQSGYGKPIRQTGDLMRDVNFKVDSENNGVKVTVGNSLNYALFVHEGTSRMRGRHYITDAITKGWERLQQVFAAYLKEGF